METKALQSLERPTLSDRLEPVPDSGAVRRHWRSGLRAKILLFSALLALLPLLVSSLSMISITRDELESSVNERLLGVVDDLIDQVSLTLVPSLRTLSLLRDALGSPTLGADDKLGLLKGAIQTLPELVAIRLASPGQPPAFLFSGGFRARFGNDDQRAAAALATPVATAAHGFDVLDPYFLDAVNLWLLPVSLHLTQDAAEPEALLTAYLDATELRRALVASAFQGSGGLWLMNARREPLFSPQAPPAPPLLERLSRDLHAAGGNAVLVAPYEDGDGTAMLGAAGMTDQPPAWTVVIGVSRRNAYAVVGRMQRDLSLWLALGLLAALIGALVLAYRIGKPIRAMAAVTERVGQGDFQARFRETGRRDEIGLLGSRLNQMIQALDRTHRHLTHQALHDSLTGLPNRRFVLNHLRDLVADPLLRASGIALLFLDLDHFKTVNDSLGHAIGDQLLLLSAERLQARLRLGPDERALAARLGGDEFLIVLTGLKERAAVSAVAEDLIEAFGEPFHLGEYELHVGGTIGISMAPEESLEVAELLDRSDMAMYCAKEKGRGQCQFFDGALKERAIRKLSLENRLRRALERGELEVYYQPQVDIHSRLIVATEALIRWPDRNGGFIASPCEFVPLAEETGLIVPLGGWVLDQVCRQMWSWQQVGLPSLSASVNVSATQFRRMDFFARVRSSLESACLTPDRLGIELTEGVLLEDNRRAIDLMARFKEMGVQILIDDFGTGYSSLAYLSRFPLDYVKVAQEFVTGIATNENDAIIVDAVIVLAKSLGLLTIAEGVETIHQLDFLARKECDLIQGFYFSRPVPAGRFEELLREQSRNHLIQPSAT